MKKWLAGIHQLGSLKRVRPPTLQSTADALASERVTVKVVVGYKLLPYPLRKPSPSISSGSRRR